MCQPSKRVLNHLMLRDHRCSPQLLTEQFLTKRNLISHDVITDASQFIAQRFSCKARICLGYFSVIVASDLTKKGDFTLKQPQV